MDDLNPNSLDALADLFLTGKPGRAAPSPNTPGEPPARTGPMKLGPKPAAARSPVEGQRPAEEAHDREFREAFDASLDDRPRLRLHPDDAEPVAVDHDDLLPQEAPPAAAVAEAVLLGNLPSLPGPWLTQYAQQLAEQDGPVVILHVDDDAIDLELVEPAAAPGTSGRRGNPVRVPPRSTANARPADAASLIETLDPLLHDERSPVRTVLVHLDPSRSGGTAVERLHDLEHWTLISGADDAAVVAGYRLLKSLLEVDGAAASARVGLMVVGSDEAAGQHAARRLRSAAAHFLHAPLEFIGFQQRMVPARCRTLGQFSVDAAGWRRLVHWLADLQPPDEAAAPVAAAPQPATAGGSRHLPPLGRPVRVQAEATPAVEDGYGYADEDDGRSGPDAPLGSEVDLLSLIDTRPHTGASIPGGIALEARCPSQPDTQLALDAAGRLHLLFRHDSSEGDPPTPREAIVELVAVRDWARQHRTLLQLTERGRRFDPDADPTLHLFTDRAEHAVHLVARLGDLLKLHLLRDVSVGEHHTLFCTPLSA